MCQQNNAQMTSGNMSKMDWTDHPYYYGTTLTMEWPTVKLTLMVESKLGGKLHFTTFVNLNIFAK